VPWAFGYWSASGSGLGDAGTGTTLPLTLSAGTPASAVYPGGSSAVAVTLANANIYPVAVPSLVLDASKGTNGFAVDGAHAGCGVGVLGFATQDNATAGWTVPGASNGTDGSLVLSLPGSLSMATNAADACQGATFTVHLRVGP
jgi:hypothetical protein